MSNKLLILLLLLFTNSLFSFTESEEILIKENFLEPILKEVSSDKKVKLNLESVSFKDDFESIIKEGLISNGYELLINEDENCHIISLKFQILEEEKVRNSLFSKKSTNEKKFKMTFELTSSDENKILDFKTYEFKNEDMTKENKFKWYDPIMVTTIIGGIVYLFYNGG